jgi:hypothetical protein
MNGNYCCGGCVLEALTGKDKVTIVSKETFETFTLKSWAMRSMD